MPANRYGETSSGSGMPEHLPLPGKAESGGAGILTHDTWTDAIVAHKRDNRLHISSEGYLRRREYHVGPAGANGGSPARGERAGAAGTLHWIGIDAAKNTQSAKASLADQNRPNATARHRGEPRQDLVQVSHAAPRDN